MKKTAIEEKNLSLMNETQKQIVLTQWQKHQHKTHEVDYDVSGEGDVLKNFEVHRGVWDPFLASGRYHARHLFYNNHLFYDKTAIEIGCGTGLMDIVMAKYGAKKVIASDISALACENTKSNAKKFDVSDKLVVVKGNLFENISEKADFITWMIPFFPGTTLEEDTISASMIMPPELFEKFLLDAKKYLNPEGKILIPAYSLGGELNNPINVAPQFGYEVKRTWTHNSINGIQQGLLYMDELRLKDGNFLYHEIVEGSQDIVRKLSKHEGTQNYDPFIAEHKTLLEKYIFCHEDMNTDQIKRVRNILSMTKIHINECLDIQRVKEMRTVLERNAQDYNQNHSNYSLTKNAPSGI